MPGTSDLTGIPAQSRMASGLYGSGQERAIMLGNQIDQRAAHAASRSTDDQRCRHEVLALDVPNPCSCERLLRRWWRRASVPAVSGAGTEACTHWGEFTVISIVCLSAAATRTGP